MSKVVKWLAAGWATFLIIVIIQANRGDRSAFYFKIVYALPYGDKIGHFCLMGIFSVLVNWALRARTLGRMPILLGSAIVFSVVLAEEMSQLFLANRTFSPADLIADVIGIVVGGRIVAAFYGRKLQPNHTNIV